MTINYTSLLGLAQPVTGTESGTWGTVVNDEITALVEEAVAGGETIDVTAGNVTLTTTNGVANQARNAILLITGTPGTSRNVVAPSSSKVYIVKNSSNGDIVLKGSATTGVTIPVNVEALCFWNGSDFEIVGMNGPSTATDNAVARFDGTTGKVIQNSTVTIADTTGDIAGAGSITSTSASGILTRAAATQDGVIMAGRAGGTSSYAVTLTPNTLSANRTLTLPDASGTVLQSGTAVTVAQGGTGLTSGTSGGIPFFSSTSAMTSSGVLAANALVIGGGAGVAPSTTTTGANVLTALGIAVGSSGAFTTNNAANTFTAAQTFRAANAVRSEAASTQDAVVLAGRAGGTGSFAVTLTPATLSSSTTLTLPNVTDTVATIGASQTFTGANTFRTTSGTRFEEASTQDAIIIDGRAGGTGSFAITLVPTTLSSSTTLTLPNVTSTVAVLGTAQTFTAAQTFRAANAIRSEAASTQDAIVIAGRAGGTSSYAITMTPATLSASRTVTFPDGGGNYTVGYRNVPAVGTQTGSYTLAVGDVGKYVQVGSGGSITIPDATFAEGDVVSVFNNTTGNITITCTITTAYIAGTDTDKASVTLATRGVATILFISSTVCVITGNVS